METFKTIDGFGDYKISNKGEVYSLKANEIKRLKDRIQKNGYNRVCLSEKGIRKYLSVHRLVAINFIPNPKNKKCVNHIDGNKLNNNVDNLEWCTHKENERHSIEFLNKKPTYKKIFRINGNEKKLYNSLKEASIENNCHRTAITNCLIGKSKTCCGYKWEYFKE
jgi:hypothetical protein